MVNRYLATDALFKEDEAKRKCGDDAQVFERTQDFSQLWVIDTATKKATEVVREDFTSRDAVSWSPDGT
ncbi:MAG TPA: hypothetical protein VIX17_20130 [Pyrinomonadaceae bacterium]|jgi:hypothetical protein